MTDVTIDYTNGIVLQVNEATRTITNGGKDSPIILGVKGDDCAERIYFEIPKHLSSFITDVTKEGNLDTDTESTIVYVNFKNAMHDTYIEQLHLLQDTPEDSTKAVFYWEITNNATEAKGDVKFNICVKRSTKDVESGEWKLQNEWHTTMFVGKVLDSVDVSRTSPTPEVIVHDTITFQTLNDYAYEYNNWAYALSDMYSYVDNIVYEEVNSKMSNYLPLAGGSMTGSINMANNKGLSFSNGGFMGDQNGYPIISSKNGSILFVGGEEYIPSWFDFPSGGGTLALVSDVNAAKNKSELVFSSPSKESTYLTASETKEGVSRLRLDLNINGEPIEGSKLKIYFHSRTQSDYIPSLMNNSFVLEMPIMKHPYNGRIVGQASHHIVSYEINHLEDDVVGDELPIMFEGIMHVTFDPNGLAYTKSDTLLFTLITKLSGQFHDITWRTALTFCIDKIEMITGVNI